MKTVVDTWEGPVYWKEGDRYFHDLGYAIEYISEEVEEYKDLPEHLYCALAQRANVPLYQVMDFIANYLDDNYGSDDYPSDVLSKDLANLEGGLCLILGNWNSTLNWFNYSCDMKTIILVKDLILYHRGALTVVDENLSSKPS